MPHFYFHLSAPDQDFQDPIGADLSDICAAHSRAMLLADRVMMFSGFADQDLDFRRWTVRVTDASQNLLMTILFPTHFPRGKWKSAAAEGVSVNNEPRRDVDRGGVAAGAAKARRNRAPAIGTAVTEKIPAAGSCQPRIERLAPTA